MTAIVVNYIFIAPEELGLPQAIGYPIGISMEMLSALLFWVKRKKLRIN